MPESWVFFGAGAFAAARSSALAAARRALRLNTPPPAKVAEVGAGEVQLDHGPVELGLTRAEPPQVDPLTGLLSRGHFERAALLELAHRRDSAEWSALLRIEIDRIGEINGSLGHAAGDDLLRQAAGRLKESLGEKALIARLGGAGFAALLPGVERSAAAAAAEAVVSAMGQPFVVEGLDAPSGAAVGLAMAPADGEDFAQLMRRADLARLRARQEGGSLWRRFEPASDSVGAARRDLLQALSEARAQQQLELYYQPIVEIVSGRTKGFEALMRWRHPALGLVSAQDFISLAEENGLISSLGCWALETACREAMRWPDDLWVAVNASPLQLRGGGLPADVKSALQASGLPPSRLEIELTEGVLIGDREFARQQLERLEQLGVSVVLDDFGAGFASFGYLCSLPFRKLKVDQSFLQEMTTRPSNAVVIKSIARLAAELGLALVVEGVDKPEQRDWLIANNCHDAQGYLFGRPMPAADVLPWLAERALAVAAA